ncbi:hypothetical protein DYI37_12650 [Fulvimarina endophytica]|uniref:Uncharacterized protein n=1 Tax=Fulvimarina endophytica TaxID=2293836 RepID=A0A371X0Q5_9HYPH|nr:hypothetical protein DYI37_12650 [Fulvimarina endophytica]
MPTGTATSAADERAVTEAPLKPSLTAEELTARLNASDICTPLTLNVNDITSLFGIAIPSFLPIDPNLRWNQNAHRVTDFVQNEGSFEATINFGCQPNSNGAILDFVGLSADRLRVPGEAFCAGALDEAGGFIGTDCTIEGRITPYIGKAIDLEGRLERAMGSSVAPDGAAPSQANETSGG